MLIGVSRVNMLQCRKMLIALLRIFEPPAPNPSHFPFFEGVVYHLNNSRKLQKHRNAGEPPLFFEKIQIILFSPFHLFSEYLEKVAGVENHNFPNFRRPGNLNLIFIKELESFLAIEDEVDLGVGA